MSYPPAHLTSQVVPDISPDMAALNLNMEDLTQSAYDLSSGGPGGVYMAQLSHFSVPNLSSTHQQSHDLSLHMLGHNLMTGTVRHKGYREVE